MRKALTIGTALTLVTGAAMWLATTVGAQGAAPSRSR